MLVSSETAFDFEAWAALAKTDPEAFEAQRRRLIAQTIETMPPHQRARLRGLQWRIDMERARYRHPLASCAWMFNQMWSAVYGKEGLVDALNGHVEPPTQSAEVIPFSASKQGAENGIALRS